MYLAILPKQYINYLDIIFSVRMPALILKYLGTETIIGMLLFFWDRWVLLGGDTVHDTGRGDHSSVRGFFLPKNNGISTHDALSRARSARRRGIIKSVCRLSCDIGAPTSTREAGDKRTAGTSSAGGQESGRERRTEQHTK